ncbi:MAG TPA: NAD(P)H-dependent oxidoreductase subunit E, partial [Bacilli bacterium]|nr:NAD(P)H-dependent oxidoreductase subunit E [Bacilli bacterium]
MRINTPQELASKIRSCEKCLAQKFSGETGTKALLVCGGLGCISTGAGDIISLLKTKIKDRGLEDKVSVDSVGCFGFCSQGPFIRVYPGETLYRMVKPEDVDRIIEEDVIGGKIIEDLIYIDPKTNQPARTEKDIDFFKKQIKIALYGSGIINPESLDEALGYGSFRAFHQVITTMKSQEVIDEILKSGLRGRGGGGFPTGRKWQFALDQKSDVKYVVCNGDEGDPGAFMDRSILEGNPFAVIEGMMIAGYAIQATAGYFYVRAEYPLAVSRLKTAIALLEEVGLIGDNILNTGFNFHVYVRLGAGAFVCGEETALLNSIEGQRGQPRPRP